MSLSGMTESAKLPGDVVVRSETAETVLKYFENMAGWIRYGARKLSEVDLPRGCVCARILAALIIQRCYFYGVFSLTALDFESV